MAYDGDHVFFQFNEIAGIQRINESDGYSCGGYLWTSGGNT